VDADHATIYAGDALHGADLGDGKGKGKEVEGTEAEGKEEAAGSIQSMFRDAGDGQREGSPMSTPSPILRSRRGESSGVEGAEQQLLQRQASVERSVERLEAHVGEQLRGLQATLAAIQAQLSAALTAPAATESKF
jgi:hypothetical protein